MKQGGNFGLAQHHRQFLGDFHADKAVVAPGHFEGDGVKKLHGGHEGVDAGGRELPLFGQVELAGADIVEPEVFGAGVEVESVIGYIMDVASLRACGEVPESHVFDHAVA